MAVAQVRKAIASVVGLLTLFGASLTDVSDGGSAITGTEWTALATAAVTAAAVFFIPNAD